MSTELEGVPTSNNYTSSWASLLRNYTPEYLRLSSAGSATIVTLTASPGLRREETPVEIRKDIRRRSMSRILLWI